MKKKMQTFEEIMDENNVYNLVCPDENCDYSAYGSKGISTRELGYKCPSCGKLMVKN